MSCRDTSERLPWYLSGSLPSDESDAVRAHLETCAECRDELEQTRHAAALFGAHVPAPALVDLAWGRTPEGVDPVLARRHLEGCAACAEELSLAARSRAALETDERPAHAFAWQRWLPVAAALLVGLATGSVWRDRAPSNAADEPERKQLAAQLAARTAEADRLQRRADELAARLERLDGPQINVPVVELMPGGPARTRGAKESDVVVPVDAGSVTLVLSALDPGKGGADVELKREDGTTLWRGQGLRPGPEGSYALSIPSALLPEGRLTIVVTPNNGLPSEPFPFRVRRAP